jgi:hypothetical protein
MGRGLRGLIGGERREEEDRLSRDRRWVRPVH